jgi:hypothetical protein
MRRLRGARGHYAIEGPTQEQSPHGYERGWNPAENVCIGDEDLCEKRGSRFLHTRSAARYQQVAASKDAPQQRTRPRVASAQDVTLFAVRETAESVGRNDRDVVPGPAQVPGHRLPTQPASSRERRMEVRHDEEASSDQRPLPSSDVPAAAAIDPAAEAAGGRFEATCSYTSRVRRSISSRR